MDLHCNPKDNCILDYDWLLDIFHLNHMFQDMDQYIFVLHMLYLEHIQS